MSGSAVDGRFIGRLRAFSFPQMARWCERACLEMWSLVYLFQAMTVHFSDPNAGTSEAFEATRYGGIIEVLKDCDHATQMRWQIGWNGTSAE